MPAPGRGFRVRAAADVDRPDGLILRRERQRHPDIEHAVPARSPADVVQVLRVDRDPAVEHGQKPAIPAARPRETSVSTPPLSVLGFARRRSRRRSRRRAGSRCRSGVIMAPLLADQICVSWPGPSAMVQQPRLVVLHDAEVAVALRLGRLYPVARSCGCRPGSPSASRSPSVAAVAPTARRGEACRRARRRRRRPAMSSSPVDVCKDIIPRLYFSMREERRTMNRTGLQGAPLRTSSEVEDLAEFGAIRSASGWPRSPPLHAEIVPRRGVVEDPRSSMASRSSGSEPPCRRSLLRVRSCSASAHAPFVHRDPAPRRADLPPALASAEGASAPWALSPQSPVAVGETRRGSVRRMRDVTFAGEAESPQRANRQRGNCGGHRWTSPHQRR